MTKTLALRKAMQIILSQVTSNVYFDEAPDTKPYPYIVYDLREVTYGYGKTSYQLEMNIVDYNTSSVVDRLADEAQTLLEKYYYEGVEIQFAVYRGTRNTVHEDDKKIRRRRLTFAIQLHEKG